jgi:hypothetical protein
VLSALLAVQIVVGILVFWPRAAVSGAEAGPLLDGFGANEVVGADDYPVDGDKVSSLLDKIESLQTDRQVTRTESSHQRLKVAQDDFERLIELQLADGDRYELYVGSSPRASATHVRTGDRSETYLTGELASYEADASAARWIDTIYYTVPQTTTVALTLKNENGEFEFERVEGNEWTMKGLVGDEKFNQVPFNSLLGQITSLRLADPIGLEEEDWFELDQSQFVVTLKTEDDQAYTLRVGAKDDGENNYYVAKWSESPYHVWLAEYVITNYLDKTRDDFLELPPPATTEADSGS